LAGFGPKSDRLLARLNETAESDPTKADALQRLRIEYERLSYTALNQERRTIIHLRNQSVISDEVLRRIQRDIDLAEARLHSHR